MRLDQFDNRAFDRGRPRPVEAIWLAVSWLFVESWLPGSGLRIFWLRLFGAKIGRGVRVKPRLRVKFPWRLETGDCVWLGEDVWVDNLANVRIGSHTCISQGAYFCTGSHDWSREDFALVTKPVEIGSHCWLGAKTRVAPGVVMEDGGVLALGSTATGRLSAWTIYSGNPAEALRERKQPGS